MKKSATTRKLPGLIFASAAPASRGGKLDALGRAIFRPTLRRAARLRSFIERARKFFPRAILYPPLCKSGDQFAGIGSGQRISRPHGRQRQRHPPQERREKATHGGRPATASPGRLCNVQYKPAAGRFPKPLSDSEAEIAFRIRKRLAISESDFRNRFRKLKGNLCARWVRFMAGERNP